MLDSMKLSKSRYIFALVLFSSIHLWLLRVQHNAASRNSSTFTVPNVQSAFNSNTATITMLIDQINLQIVHNFLSAEECTQLIQYSGTLYEPSVVVNGTDYVHSSIRESSTAVLLPNETSLVSSIESRVATFANVNINQVELLQITRYSDSQQIKQHYDYYPIEHAKRINNQRQYTMLIYLNTVEEEWGGGTHFVHFNRTIQPLRGTALFWRNAFDMYDVDPWTLHIGQPVQQKQKFILSIWFKFNPDVSRGSIEQVQTY